MDRGEHDDTSDTTRLLGRYGGIVVVGIGFAITRFFVAETVVLSGSPIAVVATVVPLVIGLALTVAGVALAVGAFTQGYVADVSRGCLLGTGAMTAVLLVTAAATGVGTVGETAGTRLLVANVLLGGAVGGLVNGHRRASLRAHQGTIVRSSNRARFINRLLRHEVLNAATIVDGHAELLRNDGVDRDRSVDAIRRSAARIESTVNGVGTIAEERVADSIRLSDVIRSALDARDDAGGTAVVDIDDAVAVADAADVDVDADDRLSIAFERLIEHALDVRGAEHVRIEASVSRHAVTVTIVDDGTPLPERQRDVLERGVFPEYDDPTSGFALQAVALLVGEYDGRIRVGNGDGTRVTLRLPRASADAATATVGVPYPDLHRTIAAGIGAGVVMGGVYWLTSGVLPVIGALYGVESVAMGWITHLFHSVVFALLFVGGVSWSPAFDRVDRPLRASVVGVAWGGLLWLVAAGVVMPLWLRATGLPAPLPNLPAVGLLAHGIWGLTLGWGYVLIDGRFD